MFEIDARDLITPETRLLFDIRELLIEITGNKFNEEKISNNNVLSELENSSTVEVPTQIGETTTPERYICKVCGKEYDNKGKLLACARKHKKEGVNNDKSD